MSSAAMRSIRGWATVLFRETAFAMRLLPYTQQKWAKDLYADRAAVNADVLSVKAEQIAQAIQHNRRALRMKFKLNAWHQISNL